MARGKAMQTTVRALAGALLLSAVAVAGGPEMPRWDPALDGMVGTWLHMRKHKKKDVKLHLVIREREDRLELMRQLPSEDRVFTSDWSGNCEVKTRLDIKGRHRPRYTVDADKARLLVEEEVKYSGSMRGSKLLFRGYYTLSDDGQQIELHCESAKQGKKDLPCPEPLIYQRLSDSTERPPKK
jgi:hypothetical protein